jgi:hypothetical protein
MRKVKTPQLPKQAGWYAALAAAGNAVYPQSDPLSGRAIGSSSIVNYAAVYERVITGTPSSPGLLSPEFLRPQNPSEPPYFDPLVPRTPSDANVGELEIKIVDWLQNYLDRQEVIYQGKRASATDFGEAISKAALDSITGTAAGALKVLRDEINIPIPTRGEFRTLWDRSVGSWFKTRRDISDQREFLPPGSIELRRQREAFEGREGDERLTPQQMLQQDVEQRAQKEQPSATQIVSEPLRPAVVPATMSQRVMSLVESLERNLQSQSFTRVPLGFQESDLTSRPNPERERLEKAANEANERANSFAPGSEERKEAEAEAAQLQTRFLATPERVLQFAPGRQPFTPAQRRAADYFNIVKKDPEKFTVGQVNLSAMVLRQRQDGGMLYEDDISPIVRSFYQRGELGALKQRLISTGFILNSDRIRDMNAPDDETVSALNDLVSTAQQRGVTWEEELNRLENDNDYLGRISQIRRKSGGGGVTYRLPSDDDLTQVFKAVSRSTIGRELPQEVYDSMIQSYKPMLLNFQRQAQSGGVVTEPPQAETFAASQIGEQFRGEQFTYGLGTQLSNFAQILGGAM